MRALGRRWPALIALAAGGALLGVGLWQGEHQVVLRKAITICMECIGLG